MDTVGSAVDIIGGHDGTCVKCPALGDGHVGSGFVFGSSDTCLTVDATGLALPAITVSIWMNQRSDGELTTVAKPFAGPSGLQDTWQLESDVMGELDWTTSEQGVSGNQQIFTPQNTLTLGTWHHIAGTFDGRTRTLYLDGAVVATGTQGAFPYDVSPMRIGCDDNGGDGELFDGLLDELQLYDRALTPSEIAALAAR